MKERCEKMTTAIPPGFNTRCISAKTSRGFVKYCTLAAHRVWSLEVLCRDFLLSQGGVSSRIIPSELFERIIRHDTLSARVATSKVLSAHGNFCCSFKSWYISPSCFVQPRKWPKKNTSKASRLVWLFFKSWSNFHIMIYQFFSHLKKVVLNVALCCHFIHLQLNRVQTMHCHLPKKKTVAALKDALAKTSSHHHVAPLGALWIFMTRFRHLP